MPLLSTKVSLVYFIFFTIKLIKLLLQGEAGQATVRATASSAKFVPRLRVHKEQAERELASINQDWREKRAEWLDRKKREQDAVQVRPGRIITPEVAVAMAELIVWEKTFMSDQMSAGDEHAEPGESWPTPLFSGKGYLCDLLWRKRTQRYVYLFPVIMRAIDIGTALRCRAALTITENMMAAMKIWAKEEGLEKEEQVTQEWIRQKEYQYSRKLVDSMTSLVRGRSFMTVVHNPLIIEEMVTLVLVSSSSLIPLLSSLHKLFLQVTKEVEECDLDRALRFCGSNQVLKNKVTDTMTIIEKATNREVSSSSLFPLLSSLHKLFLQLEDQSGPAFEGNIIERLEEFYNQTKEEAKTTPKKKIMKRKLGRIPGDHTSPRALTPRKSPRTPGKDSPKSFPGSSGELHKGPEQGDSSTDSWELRLSDADDEGTTEPQTQRRTPVKKTPVKVFQERKRTESRARKRVKLEFSKDAEKRKRSNDDDDESAVTPLKQAKEGRHAYSTQEKRKVLARYLELKGADVCEAPNKSETSPIGRLFKEKILSHVWKDFPEARKTTGLLGSFFETGYPGRKPRDPGAGLKGFICEALHKDKVHEPDHDKKCHVQEDQIEKNPDPDKPDVLRPDLVKKIMELFDKVHKEKGKR